MNSAPIMALLIIFIWPFSSGKTYHMKASNNIPAATGTVKVQKNGNDGNTRLDIKVNHLAKPTSLTPPENVYIVWIRPHDGTAAKKGIIRVDKNLNGELKVVTVSKNFDVFITAEQSPSVTEPTGDEVLDAQVNVG